MHTKATVGALVIGPAAAVLYADARWDSLTLTVAAPFAGAALVVLFVLAGAGARARKDFFAYFARTRRFSYCDEAEVRPLTPLLRAGDRRQFAHYMEGPLPPAAAGLGCALTHYTFEVERHDDDGRHWESHPFTICVVELECAIQRFSDFFLCSRGEIPGRLGRLLDDEACWIPHSASHALELESSAFADRFELRTRSAQNEIALRQLFSPSFIVWLATHPLAPKFEYSAGTVVLYLDGHIDDGGKLDFFLEAAAQIAGRITAEVRESVAIGR